jgi:hypothetical protein
VDETDLVEMREVRACLITVLSGATPGVASRPSLKDGSAVNDLAIS